MKKFISILFFVGMVICSYLYAKEWYVLEDFEGLNYWSVVSWKTSTKKVSIVKENPSEGEHSLKVDFDYSTWSDKAQIMIEQSFDFSSVDKISFDIYNPTKNTFIITLALCTGEKWEWFESQEQKIIPGWNKDVVFSIVSPTFKSARTNWRNITKVEKLNDVRRLVLTFVGGEGPVYIDNIRVYSDKKIDKISPTVRVIGDKIIFESFEDDKTEWDKAKWETQAVGVKLSKDWSSDGKQSLQLIFRDVTSSNKASYALEGDFDWSKVNRFYVDVYNPTGKTILINLALSTGEGWIWYESPDKVINEKEVKDVEFDLNAKNFKCEATNWNYSSYVKNKDKVKRICIQVLAPAGETLSGSIYIDNLRITEGEPLVIKEEVKPPKFPEIIEVSKYKTPVIKSVVPNAKMVGKYDKFEVSMNINAYFNNPYNPEEIDVEGIFFSPDGTVYKVPGFYYEEFRQEGKEFISTGKKYWMIRFSPNKEGKWEYNIVVKNPAGKTESEKMMFECVSSNNKGFVGISSDKRYFKFSNGQTYFLIGQNVCWVTASDSWRFPNYLRKLNETGQNWTRIWNCPWGLIIEWGEPRGQGLGRYNQKDSFEFDKIIELAESLGIYIQFCLDYHGAFHKEITWEQNAYNYKNGGPCKEPIEFFKDPTAKDYYKRRLRYIVARWGYSRAIMSWEFFNEVDLISDYDEKVVADWHKEMANYLKSIDFAKHLITTSFARVFAGDKIYSLEEIDYTQTHMYSDEVLNGVYNVSLEKMRRYKKPTFFGEIGGAVTDISVESKDKKGILLHDALWSSIMSMSAGTAMYWWWDGHIKANNLYYHYTAVSRFLKDIDYIKMNFSHADAQCVSENMHNDLIYAPPLDWEKSIGSELTIDKSGVVKGGLLSRYFQSPKWHKDMYVLPTFNVEYPTDGKFSIYVIQSAKIGANLKIYLDDKLALSHEFPKGRSDHKIQQSFDIDVPKGKHVIKVVNDGDDWFNVGYIAFTNVLNDCQVIGLKNNEKNFVMLWLKNPRWNVKNYLAGVEIKPIKNAKIEVKDIQNGQYVIDFWDTWNGVVLEKKEVEVNNNVLTFTSPEFSYDIACKIYKK